MPRTIYKTYATTFCNKAHRLYDGKPVGHECYVLIPEKLRLEANGGMPDAPVHHGVVHRGIHPRKDTP